MTPICIMGNDLFICHIWDMTHLYVTYGTWLIYMWYMGHDSFICDIWDMTHLYVTYGTWLIYMWYMGHDSFICDIWDMTHSNETWTSHTCHDISMFHTTNPHVTCLTDACICVTLIHPRLKSVYETCHTELYISYKLKLVTLIRMYVSREQEKYMCHTDLYICVTLIHFI